MTVDTVLAIKGTGNLIGYTTSNTVAVQDLNQGGVFNYTQGKAVTVTSITTSGDASIFSTAHGLKANDRVVFSGGLPSTIIAGVVYYVISANLTPNSFSIALGYEGTPIAGAASGVSAAARQVYFSTRVLPGVAAIAGSPSVITTQTTIQTTSGPVVVPIAHGLNVNDAITFAVSGGSLGTVITQGTTYYVVSPTITTFSVSLTPGGSAISTGTTSGTINIQQVYQDDGGVVFYDPRSGVDGWWIRQYEEAEGVNVMWFGLYGDGVNDDSSLFQSAYNRRYHVYNFPQRDFLMGNINLCYPNICLRSESAIYRTPLVSEKGTRIFLPAAGGAIFYTTADITGSRFYGIQLNGSKATSGSCRGMIIGRDSGLVIYPADPYSNYSVNTDHTVIKCTFEFMQFVSFQQEGWLGEDSGAMIISKCFGSGCLKDITYLTQYRAALAVYGNDCFIEHCEFGAWGANGKTSASMSLAIAIINAVSTGSITTITTGAPHGFSAGDTVSVFGVMGMTQLNNLSGVVSSIPAPTATTFSINIDSSGFTAYSANGSVLKSLINSITTGASTVIGYSVPPPFNKGDVVTILGVAGMTQLNNLSGPVTNFSASIPYSITVNINSTGFSGTPSGGAVIKPATCGIGLFGRDAAGNAERNCSWITDCVGELCDAGIYIGQPNARVTACRPDHTAGYGFIVDDNRCQLSNCTSFDNSIAGSGNFDGFLITSNAQGTQFSNCLNYSDTATPAQVRYGFNDLSGASLSAGSKTRFSNCQSIRHLTGAFNYLNAGTWYQAIDDCGANLFIQITPAASFTTPTGGAARSLFGIGVGPISFPANFFCAGKTIKARVSGVYSNSANSSFYVNTKIGTATITPTATSALATAASNQRFVIELYVTCLTITTFPSGVKTPGSVQLDGSITYNTTSGNIVSDPINNGGGAAITLDTTSFNNFDINVTINGAATTTITPTIALIEAIN